MVFKNSAPHSPEHFGSGVQCSLSRTLRSHRCHQSLDRVERLCFPIQPSSPKVICTVFEDNKSCIEIATNHQTRPHTKHLSVRLHHFQSHIDCGTINIKHISSKDQ